MSSNKLMKTLIDCNYRHTSLRFHYSDVLKNRASKRGQTLKKMLANSSKDKNKHWLFNLIERPPNAKRVFEKVHRPNKRQNILDCLFIKNITDVLSTSDVAPDISGSGVEITGVRVSPCFKILNVYWQIPPDSYDSHEEIALTLFQCAPRLRAELISRNVMGKVPHIFFVRDETNARIADFENAIKDADLGPEDQLSIIPDEEFTKDILVFRTSRNSKLEKNQQITDKSTSDNVPRIPKANYNLPQRPANMKSNVFGLNYDIMMGKVLSARSRPKTFSQNSAVISSEFFPSAELFDKIPGTPLQPGEDKNREKLLKQFQVERKILKKQKQNFRISEDDSLIAEPDDNDCGEELQFAADNRDYVEEETSESRFH